MLSQMNYRKETQSHGDELFPLSIHVSRQTCRVTCGCTATGMRKWSSFMQ